MADPVKKRALLMGFFSTVGDVDCLQFVGRSLDHLSIPFDVAPYSQSVRREIPGAVDPRKTDAGIYSHLIIVCGPCWKEFFRRQKVDLDRFRNCLKIGVNLTMIDPVEVWNPFHILIERDSDRAARPDLSFLEPAREVPFVGRCLAPGQQEYRERQRHDLANRAINDLIARKGLAVVDIDTRWPFSSNRHGLKDANQVFTVIKRTDVLLTTRLHGLVYALKAGIPVIAVDAVSGGDKVTAQARTLGWPMVVSAEMATFEWMDQAFEWCLSPEAKRAVETCRQHILPALRDTEEELIAALSTQAPLQEPATQLKRPRFHRWLQRRKPTLF
ncbi:polysaccharide pyruvyl transferase family protein [bacterium]|nr:polysaccharide pyruvyl transferase family protein [bacterium]